MFFITELLLCLTNSGVLLVILCGKVVNSRPDIYLKIIQFALAHAQPLVLRQESLMIAYCNFEVLNLFCNLGG